MNRNDCVELGYISKAHGLRGDVKVSFDVHDIEEYYKLGVIFLSKGSAPLKPYSIQRLQIKDRKRAYMSFEGINDRNAAEALIGHTLYFPIAKLPKLESGKFYYFEVIDFQVVDQKLGELGTVKGFYDGPAQDILVMMYQDKEVLIPMTDEFVQRADHEAKQVLTSIPEGLLEVYLEE